MARTVSGSGWSPTWKRTSTCVVSFTRSTSRIGEPSDGAAEHLLQPSDGLAFVEVGLVKADDLMPVAAEQDPGWSPTNTAASSAAIKAGDSNGGSTENPPNRPSASAAK